MGVSACRCFLKLGDWIRSLNVDTDGEKRKYLGLKFDC